MLPLLQYHLNTDPLESIRTSPIESMLKKKTIYQTVLKAHTPADIISYCKLTLVMALDGVMSFLSLKDGTNTCKPMQYSPTIGGKSSVQWRKVG